MTTTRCFARTYFLRKNFLHQWKLQNLGVDRTAANHRLKEPTTPHRLGWPDFAVCAASSRVLSRHRTRKPGRLFSRFSYKWSMSVCGTSSVYVWRTQLSYPYWMALPCFSFRRCHMLPPLYSSQDESPFAPPFPFFPGLPRRMARSRIARVPERVPPSVILGMEFNFWATLAFSGGWRCVF